MANNAPWQLLKTSDAVKWLRQRTNTTSSNAWAAPDNATGGNEGIWSDAEIVRKLNYAMRHVAQLMMTADPYSPYFINLNPQVSAYSLPNGAARPTLLYLTDPYELPTLATEWGFARVLYVRFSNIAANAPVGFPDLRGKSIREVGMNRLVMRARRTVASSNEAETKDSEVTFSVEFTPAASPTGSAVGDGKALVCQLRFENFPQHPDDDVSLAAFGARGYKLDVFYTQYPTMLDVGLTNPEDEVLAIPPVSYNAVLRYAEIAMLCDEGNIVRMSTARQLWEEERSALLAAMHQNFDQPGGMNEIREASFETRGQR